MNDSSLGDYLSITVPFLVHELAEQGGPTVLDYVRLKIFKRDFVEFGADNMMFPSTLDKREYKKAGSLWGEFAFAVAMMSFNPGGIKFAGCHFSAGAPDRTGAQYWSGLLPPTQALLSAFWADCGSQKIAEAFVDAASYPAEEAAR